MLATFGQAEDWKVDKVHSWVGFEVSHLVVSKTKGRFTDFEGEVKFDGKDLTKGTVNFTVQTASINTEDEKRDAHLKSPDFFDAEKFPTMTFVSKKVVVEDDDEFKLVGDLTIRGVTKEVTFECEFRGSIDTPWGFKKAGFSAETTIDRQEFDVSWSQSLDAGGLVVGNDVELILELEFDEVTG
jgi:polyisoprenoid-binding protein YceI